MNLPDNSITNEFGNLFEVSKKQFHKLSDDSFEYHPSESTDWKKKNQKQPEGKTVAK